MSWFEEKQNRAKQICCVDTTANDCAQGKLSSGLSGNKGFASVLREAASAKFAVAQEPLLRSTLHGLQLNAYLGLKRKARIIVEDSATLVGVVDADGILEENEVFVQIRRDSFKNHEKGAGSFEKARISQLMDGAAHVLTGDLLMTRNPCTHPGDLRVLTAVDKPELSRVHYNTVVFSSKGQRPMCNMMAGGDLDGDVYFVCWDESLRKHLKKENLVEAAKYEKPKILTEKPQGDSLADYFCFYLERDVLGKIANLHLALCDYYGRYGPMHEDCVYLSHLCSVAVDFAKHGECVSKDCYKHLEELIEEWPDFFEKENKEIRASDGILGQLYRSLSCESVMAEFHRRDYNGAVLLEYELEERFLSLCDAKDVHRTLSVLFN